MEGIIYKELSYQLNGILFAVQNSLGTKFQEKHYIKATCAYLDELHVPYVLEFPFELKVKGKVLGSFRVDLIVDNKILMEFKTVGRLTIDHKMQILRYLEALDLRLGLLVNFRVRPIQIWRVTN